MNPHPCLPWPQIAWLLLWTNVVCWRVMFKATILKKSIRRLTGYYCEGICIRLFAKHSLRKGLRVSVLKCIFFQNRMCVSSIKVHHHAFTAHFPIHNKVYVFNQPDRNKKLFSGSVVRLHGRNSLAFAFCFTIRKVPCWYYLN